MKKKIIALILFVAMLSAALICLCSCKKDYVYVKMTVKDFGDVVLELDPNNAPKTVKNFVGLVEDGFYDGLTFHRVIEDFMIQGGDPNADGTGGSDKTIKGEFSANGHKNSIPHERGVISMGRTQDYDSASSQFFICNADCFGLDGNYAAFGRVVEGMEVIDAITEASIPFTPYYEYYGTDVYEYLKQMGQLPGNIDDKDKQVVILKMEILEDYEK